MWRIALHVRLCDANNSWKVWTKYMTHDDLCAVLRVYDYAIAWTGRHNAWNVDIIPKEWQGHRIKLVSKKRNNIAYKKQSRRVVFFVVYERTITDRSEELMSTDGAPVIVPASIL
jgi:hypothetical protein